MTLLQMTGMYQAIASDGVRMPPRIIKSTIAADGTRTDEPRPEGVQRGLAANRETVRQHAARDGSSATRRAFSGAPGSAGGRRGATRSPARRAPHSRSTLAAAATTTTSTGSPSPGMAPCGRSPLCRRRDDATTRIRTADGTPGTTVAPLFHNIAAVAVAAGERAAVAGPRPAADAAGRLSGRPARHRPVLCQGHVLLPCRPAVRRTRRARWRTTCAARHRAGAQAASEVAGHQGDAAQPGRRRRRRVRGPARRVGMRARLAARRPRSCARPPRCSPTRRTSRSSTIVAVPVLMPAVAACGARRARYRSLRPSIAAAARSSASPAPPGRTATTAYLVEARPARRRARWPASSAPWGSASTAATNPAP